MAVDEGAFQRFVGVGWNAGGLEVTFAQLATRTASLGLGTSRQGMVLFLTGDQQALVPLGSEIAFYDGVTLIFSALSNYLAYVGGGFDYTEHGYVMAAEAPGQIHFHTRPTSVEFDTISGRQVVLLTDPPWAYVYDAAHTTSYRDIHNFTRV